MSALEENNSSLFRKSNETHTGPHPVANCMRIRIVGQGMHTITAMCYRVNSIQKVNDRVA